jgi:DNA polymerase-1
VADRLYLVDGHSHLFRAYHAVGYLSTSRGVPSHAVLILSTMLWKLIREERPQYLGIAWDAPGATFRDRLFEEYKATRVAMPPDLVQQLPYVRRLFEALGTPVVEVAGFEADDVLGTLVARVADLDLEVVIVTGDKDLLQLVGPKVTVLSVVGRTGERVLYDAAKVRERWGVDPPQIPDVLALMGDSIDNIPGVRGVGEKTAVKLLSQFGSLDRLYDNLVLVPGKLREALAANRKQALLSRELATVSRQVPVELDLDSFRLREPNWPKLRALWTEMEFSRLLRELPAQVVVVSVEPVRMLETPEALATYLSEAPGSGPLAVDWAGDPRPPDPRLGGLGLFHPVAGAAYVPLSSGHPAPAAKSAPPSHGDRVAVATLLGRRELIIHDAKPVIGWLLSAGVEVSTIQDTAVAAYLLNPARASYPLDQLCMEVFGEGPPSFDGAAALGEVERGDVELGARLGDRARWVWRYWTHVLSELDALALRAIYDDIERPLVPVLARMEQAGIRVDVERLEGFAKELERSLDALTHEIYVLAGEPFTIGSPKQLGQILFEKLKLPALRKTKTGYSTDADVLTELALGHELPAKILEYRSLSKLKSTYADALPALINPVSGRIHATFHQLVAATGRLSSSDPNIQNIPIRTELGRRIRAAFIPEDGWRFVAADYSQIELRILAHCSGEESIIEAFRRDEDIHTRTAAEVLKVSPAVVTDEQRRVAKMINYALLYGVSAFGLAQGARIPKDEAERYIRDYYAAHPKVRRFIDTTLTDGRERGYVLTCLGRRRYLPDLKSGNPTARNAAERMAMNAPIQGSSADMIKLAMVRIDAALRERGLRTRMLLQVHDELVFESPVAEVPEVERLVREVMEAAMPLSVPIRVDVKSGDDWSRV